MKEWLLNLPGPLAIKVVIATVVAIAGIVALFFVYDWIGTNLLDAGGGIG